MSDEGALALGVDIGTSAVRTVLLNEEANEIAIASRRFEDVQKRDPIAWRALMFEALDELPDLDAVRAIAMDGTSGTMLALDKDNEPVGAPIMYDERVEDSELVVRLDREAPRGAVAVGSGSGAARTTVLAARSGATRIVYQADWLVGALTGRFDLTDENNALKTGYDPIRRKWPGWLMRAGVPVDRLPRVHPVGSMLASVSPSVSARTGLPTNAVVVAGTTDGCASFLATGASKPGEGVTSLGSTLVVKLLSDRPVSAPSFGIYSHRVGDMWLPGGASNTGGRVLAQFYDGATIEALSARIDLSEPVAEAYYPLPEPGERFPVNDPDLAPRMPPAEWASTDPIRHLHALLDGMARVEAEGYRRLTELGAPALARVLTVGSGARNAAWMALRERHLGVPVVTAPATEAAIGTARIALAHIRGEPLGQASA